MSVISVFAWILVWAIVMGGLLYLHIHARPWLEERKELKKLRAWLHKFERGEVEEDG